MASSGLAPTAPQPCYIGDPELDMVLQVGCHGQDPSLSCCSHCFYILLAQVTASPALISAC